MKTVTLKFSREVSVNHTVAQWNSWDHEHLMVGHKSYTDVKILFENKDVVVMLMRFRLPIFSFIQSDSLMVTIKDSEFSEINFNMGLFRVPSTTKILYEPLGPESCRTTTVYSFYLRGWRRLLEPFLSRMTKHWNDRIWKEDLPIRLRRQMMLNLGFKDFSGLPERREDRVAPPSFSFHLPVTRPKNSPLNPPI